MPESEQGPLSTELLFKILADADRRRALQCLNTYDNPMTLADVADEVARRKYDAPLTELPAADVKRVYMRLYHTHIPKMEDANILEYDQETDTVQLTWSPTDVTLDEVL